MKHRNLLIGVGVACFIVFVVVALPAKVITALVPAEIVQIGGTSGTLWRGEATLVQISGVQLTNTRWTLHPLQLLLGRVALHLETNPPGGSVSSDLTLGITGTVTVKNFDATGRVAPLAQLMKLPPSGGDISMQIELLTIKNDWPRNIVGKVRIGNLPLNLIGVAAGPVGSYEVRFAADPVPEDGRIVGELQDLGGPLELRGSIYFAPPSNYELDANVKASMDAPADLSRGLALLGPADASGNHQLMMSGSF
jgi:general secretion pathway protein N